MIATKNLSIHTLFFAFMPTIYFYSFNTYFLTSKSFIDKLILLTFLKGLLKILSNNKNITKVYQKHLY
jgi:hypothetical protein